MGFFHWKKKTVDNIEPASGFFHSSKKLILSLHEKVWKLEFNPRKFGEYWKKNKFFVSGVIAIVFALVLTIISSRGKASEANFYASKCLGGWQFIENATGEPSLKANANLDEFNQKNSAILNQSISDMYCGGFAGEIPKDVSPGKITVNFSLAVTDQRFVEETPDIDTIIDSNDPIIQTEEILNENSEESSAEEQSTEVQSAEQEVEEKKSTEEAVEKKAEPKPELVPEIKTEEKNKPEENKPEVKNEEESAPTGFFFFRKARAQETEIPAEPTPEPVVSEPVDSESSEPAPETKPAPELTQDQKPESSSEDIPEKIIEKQEPKIEPKIEPKLESKTEEKETPKKEVIPEEKEQIETEEVVDEEPLIEEVTYEQAEKETPEEEKLEGFLEALYSLDGTEWKHLGYVNKQNWQNLSFSLDESDLSWEEISNIQIELKSLQTFDELPVIYLDAVWLSVSYEELLEPEEEEFGLADPKKLRATNIQSSSSDFNLGVEQDINQGEQLLFSAQSNTNIRFYLSSDPTFGFFLQVGSEPAILPTYNLTSGNFIAVNTKLETTCDVETVLDCLNSPDFIGAVNFTLISSLDPVVELIEAPAVLVPVEIIPESELEIVTEEEVIQ